MMCFAYLQISESLDQIISATATLESSSPRYCASSSRPDSAESGTSLHMLPVASSAISCCALFILSLFTQI
jgi:hypothetical protein